MKGVGFGGFWRGRERLLEENRGKGKGLGGDNGVQKLQCCKMMRERDRAKQLTRRL